MPRELLLAEQCGTFHIVNWMIYAVGGAVALAAADVCVKLAAGKLPDSLGMLLYGAIPFLTGAVWYASDRARGISDPVQPRAVISALAVGIAFTLVTFALYAAFRKGAPISLASPLVRLGGLLLASAAGFFFWREPVTARVLVGIGLACSGVYLIVSR